METTRTPVETKYSALAVAATRIGGRPYADIVRGFRPYSRHSVYYSGENSHILRLLGDACSCESAYYILSDRLDKAGPIAEVSYSSLPSMCGGRVVKMDYKAEMVRPVSMGRTLAPEESIISHPGGIPVGIYHIYLSADNEKLLDEGIIDLKDKLRYLKRRFSRSGKASNLYYFSSMSWSMKKIGRRTALAMVHLKKNFNNPKHIEEFPRYKEHDAGTHSNTVHRSVRPMSPARGSWMYTEECCKKVSYVVYFRQYSTAGEESIEGAHASLKELVEIVERAFCDAPFVTLSAHSRINSTYKTMAVMNVLRAHRRELREKHGIYMLFPRRMATNKFEGHHLIDSMVLFKKPEEVKKDANNQ